MITFEKVKRCNEIAGRYFKSGQKVSDEESDLMKEMAGYALFDWLIDQHEKALKVVETAKELLDNGYYNEEGSFVLTDQDDLRAALKEFGL